MADNDKLHLIVIPRKLLIIWLVTNLAIAAMIIGSFQYTNWVDRRSNQLLCGIFLLFDDAYKKAPPTTEAGKLLAVEFNNVVKKFGCK